MEEKIVSVIVPVYNVEKYLKECIESIINQTYKNLEIILVDDGSTDSCPEICDDYACKDSRISVIHKENGWLAEARNSGMEKSSGDYIIFFDSDDVMDNKAIENLVKKISNTDIVIGNYKTTDESGNLLGTENIVLENRILTKDELYCESCKIPSFVNNKLYKASIIKKNNIKFVSIRAAEDLNFFLKYISFIEKCRFIDDTICYYRYVKTSLSRQFDFKIYQIVDIFKDLEDFYIANDNQDIIDFYLPVIKLYHYVGQMNKLFGFENKQDRKKVFDFFYDKINDIDFSKSKVKYKKMLVKVKIKKTFEIVYISNFYRKIYCIKNKDSV